VRGSQACSSEEMARLMKREADEMDVLVNVLGLRTQLP